MSKKTNRQLRRIVAWHTLMTEHAEIEDRLQTICDLARSGDWREVNARWDSFAEAVEAHMTFEEKHLLPAFAASSGAARSEASAIRREHSDLRNRLQQLGIAVQTHHAFALREVEELIERLRSHAKREDAVFYPWLDQAKVAHV